MTEHKYIHNTQHRDGNPNKSQWIIGFADEEEIWNNTPYSINYLCYSLFQYRCTIRYDYFFLRK